MHACMHAYIHTCIHAYMRTCVHAYMRTCVHAYMHTCIMHHAYMHTCIHAYMHTCIHAYMHTCIHLFFSFYARPLIFIPVQNDASPSKGWVKKTIVGPATYVSYRPGWPGTFLGLSHTVLRSRKHCTHVHIARAQTLHSRTHCKSANTPQFERSSGS